MVLGEREGERVINKLHEPDIDNLRVVFELLVAGRDSYGLKRSRKGTYQNPAIARDWKWFQLGAASQRVKDGQRSS